jgi:hypothetical protein
MGGRLLPRIWNDNSIVMSEGMKKGRVGKRCKTVQLTVRQREEDKLVVKFSRALATESTMEK